MSDVIDKDQEEETSAFGLGRGLDALFGDDEIMGMDDESPSGEAISETVMEEEESADEQPDMAALMAEETHTDTDTVTVTATVEEEDEHLIDEIETLIETLEEESTPLSKAAKPEKEAVAEQNIITEEQEKELASSEAEDIIESTAKPQSIEDEEAAAPKSGRNRYNLPIENLYPSPFQPRKIFNQDSIDELASSISQYGVLQPLLVRKDPKNDDGYEIIAGERRWRASQQAQLHELPVVILEISELEAYKIALIENLQREDIDPIDEAYGYQKLLEDFGQTQEQLAEAVGKSRPHITNTLRLLQLPPLAQAMVSEKALTMGHARALIGVENAEEIAQKVYKQGLSVRQTEKLAAAAKGKTQQKRPRSGNAPANTSAPEKDTDTIALENDISNALGMNVSIDSADGKSGKLSVEFKSLDQLDEVLHRLAHFPSTRLNG